MLEKTLESSLDSREIKPVNPKDINPEYLLDRPMLKLKLQYFGHLMWRADSLEKTDSGKDWGQEEKGATEDEMGFPYSSACRKIGLQLPGAGAPPVAKVMRKEARHTQRRDPASGVPLEILGHLPPKPESVYFLLCALTYTSDFTGGCPPLLLS